MASSSQPTADRHCGSDFIPMKNEDDCPAEKIIPPFETFYRSAHGRMIAQWPIRQVQSATIKFVFICNLPKGLLVTTPTKAVMTTPTKAENPQSKNPIYF